MGRFLGCQVSRPSEQAKGARGARCRAFGVLESVTEVLAQNLCVQGFSAEGFGLRAPGLKLRKTFASSLPCGRLR